jgi:hypothetical protein
MAILNVKTQNIGESGQVPSFMYIETNDPVATITTAGYLNAIVSQKLTLYETQVAVVTTKESSSAASVSNLYNVTFSSGNWSLNSISGTGSISGATNLGSGNGIFASVSGANLQFKGLIAGTNITLTSTGTGITVSSTSGGIISGATSLGAGTSIVNATPVSGSNLQFNSIAGTGVTTATLGTNEVVINTPAPTGVVYNLQLSWLSNTTLGVAAGSATDSTNLYNMILSAPVTLNADTTGANGIDTGSFAENVMYAIYIIGSSTSQTFSASLMSASATAPILPAGYNIFRRIGYIGTFLNEAVFANFQQTGSGLERSYYYTQLPTQILANGASTTWANVLLNPTPHAVVPNVPASEVLISTSGNTGINPYSLTPYLLGLPASYLDGVIQSLVQVDTYWVPYTLNAGAATIMYILSDGADTISLFVRGFKDYL